MAFNLILPSFSVAALPVQIPAFDPHLLPVIVSQNRERVLLLVCAITFFDNQASDYFRARPPRIWICPRPNGPAEPNMVPGTRVSGAVFLPVVVFVDHRLLPLPCLLLCESDLVTTRNNNAVLGP